MANETESKSEILEGTSKWVTLMRGVNGARLGWIRAVLGVFGIEARVANPWTISGSIILVERGRLGLANDIINRALGGVNLEGFTLNVAVSDLPDDCPLFNEYEDQDAILGRVLEIWDDLASGTKYSAIKVPTEPPVEVPDTETTDIEIEQPDEVVVPDEQEESNVIPIKKEEPSAPEESEEDSWLSDGEDDDFADEEDDPEEEPANPLSNMEEGTEWMYAEANLQSQDMKFPGKKGTITITMFDVQSSNVSAIGYRVSKQDNQLTTFYIRFKQGTTYRYSPVPLSRAQALLGEAVKVFAGYQEASVGVLFGILIKEKAEAGEIKCQRLKEDHWEDVLPKSQRKQQIRESNA